MSERVRASSLDRRISLMRRTAVRDARTGEELGEWKPFVRDANPWAQVIAVDGARSTAGPERASASTTKDFVIWWRDDVTVEDRVVYEDLAYDIESLEEIGRREGLKIRGVARAER
ncbi:MAG TPA: phage head closure protein [Vicinamibacterales bacterium]|nr:phage head closure protein [Vicinamibacterales bacterium]